MIVWGLVVLGGLCLLGGWFLYWRRTSILSIGFLHAPHAIIVTDRYARILKVNRTFNRITGYCSSEVVGKKPSILSSGRQDRKFYAKMWRELSEKGHWQGELWNRRKNGEVFPERLAISAVTRLHFVQYYVGAFSDITENKRQEEIIKRLAYYDTLTNLPNRRLLEAKLEKALTEYRASGCFGAILFIDLDNFKSLNDTLGHAQGDLLLIEVARRIESETGRAYTISRWGGDEFVVLMQSLSNDFQASIAIAEELSERLLNRLEEVFWLEKQEYYSSCSIGLAMFDEQTSVSDLLKNADSAMYQAKTAGRNCIRVFDPALQAVTENRIQLEKALQHAVGDEQLMLHFQPQVRNDDELFGAEVLLRWHHPEKGMISPSEFIPVAEQSDLIVTLGDWVLKESCRMLADWKGRACLSALNLSVNVSERQLRQPDFVDKLLSLIQHYRLEPRRLKIEITETGVMQNLQDYTAKMKLLKEKGIEFSMDDFGTGYSSLSNIRALPLNQLKIDQSFVRQLDDEDSRKLTQTIIRMSEALGMDVVAEGVEHFHQHALLRQMGCHRFQGFLFSQPLERQAFEEYAQSLYGNR